MKIIKHGHIPELVKVTRRFQCLQCNCIFEADKDEYCFAGPAGQIRWHGELLAPANGYYCECPECQAPAKEITRE